MRETERERERGERGRREIHRQKDRQTDVQTDRQYKEESCTYRSRTVGSCPCGALFPQRPEND